MQKFGEKANFIWSIAELIRDVFKRSKYQDVILPFTVLRRIDCVLAPTRVEVRRTHEEMKGKIDNPDARLRRVSGFAFYNTSKYDFDALVSDSRDLALNLKNYINGFSENMRQVLEKFDFMNTIDKLDEAGLLFLVLERFNTIDLHPDVVSNHEMGYIFEELIRRFNEALNENPGEHFTPREVIQLMVDLLVVHDRKRLEQRGISVWVYDPCCGTGGMLTASKERIQALNESADVQLFGQEVNGETFAVCKSDLYMKSTDGRDAENIMFGSTLSNDQHRDKRFDYLIANPPYGKDWKMDKIAVEDEATRGFNGRFGAGTPSIRDGQLLFLQHMIARMRDPEEGGSRIAIVMNGSPLFTGDAGSGESEIRRWILEKDWLDTIVALPGQLFYNTDIVTYVWILTNRKEDKRKNKVQLINAGGEHFWTQMRKSLGKKRRQIADEQIAEIVGLYEQYDADESEYSKIFDTIDFGYRKVTIERPLRMNFHATEERIQRLREETGFQNLAKSKKRDPQDKAEQEAEGRALQEQIIKMLGDLPDVLYKNRPEFMKVLKATAKKHDIKLNSVLNKAILSALGEKDETADICKDKDGNPEADSDLRDYEYVPLEADTDYWEDPLSYESVPLKQNIHDYFQREVVPFMPEAWINIGVTDPADGEIGKVGYEINFNRYFYKYQPPRPLEEIESDLKQLEAEILEMLQEVTE